jgi:2,3-bisphosphoglycerate-dependent phosphoglycerate mutase
VLRRAVRTGAIAMAAARRAQAPKRHDWRLNERCYGALQGRERRAVRAQYGDERYRMWRRSYDAAPPPLEPGSEWDTTADPRYAALAPGIVPRTESLADVVARLLPYWREAIVPDLRQGTVLVTAHGNSLRALVAHLDRLSRDEVLGLDIPTGMPLRYDLDGSMSPLVRGGRYLDPEAARKAAAEVANLGSAPREVNASRERAADRECCHGQTDGPIARTLPR